MDALEEEALSERTLTTIAGFDARLSALIANSNNGTEPLSAHLAAYYSLDHANKASHEHLAEPYTLAILNSTRNHAIIDRLRTIVTLHALGLYKNKTPEEVSRALEQDIARVREHEEFFQGIASTIETLVKEDYSDIANQEFGGFRGLHNPPLYPSLLQRYVINELLSRRRIGAYLPVGTGKTAIAILAGEKLLRQQQGGKVIILCTSASYDEFMTGLTGGERQRYLKRTPKSYFLNSHQGLNREELRKAEYFILNFAYLRTRTNNVRTQQGNIQSCLETLIEEPWTFIVADEPQVMMDSSSRRALDVKLLLDKAEQERRHALILTGTPVKDNRESIKTQIGFLDPALEQRIHTEGVTQEELFTLADTRTVQLTEGMARTRTLQPIVTRFELPEESRRAYEELEQSGIHKGAFHHIIKKFLVDFTIYDLHSLRPTTQASQWTNPKLEHLIKQLHEWIQLKEKFVLFFDYTKGFLEPKLGYSLAERIRELLGREGKHLEVYRLDNKPSTWRYKIFEQFRENPETIGVALPRMSCSLALNLQVARHIILPTPLEDPAMYEQLQGRINREGQEQPPDLHVLVYKNTIEEARLQKLEERQRNAKLLKYFILPKGAREVRTTYCQEALHQERKEQHRQHLGIASSAGREQPTINNDILEKIVEEETPELPQEKRARMVGVDTLKAYFRDIGRQPILSRDEEQQAAKLASMGDKRAYDKLVEANLRWVVSIARYWRGRGLDIEDLIQEGSLGLLRAAEKFEPERLLRLTTYSAWHIKQRIRRGLDDTSRTVRVPSTRMLQVNRWNNAKQSLEQELTRPPTIEEIAEKLHITDQKIARKIANAARIAECTARLDYEPTTNDKLLDRVPDTRTSEPEITLRQQETGREIRTALEKLRNVNNVYATVLELRYGLDGKKETLKTVGELLHLSRERIRQLQREAEKELQAIISRTLLPEERTITPAKRETLEEKIQEELPELQEAVAQFMSPECAPQEVLQQEADSLAILPEPAMPELPTQEAVLPQPLIIEPAEQQQEPVPLPAAILEEEQVQELPSLAVFEQTSSSVVMPTPQEEPLLPLTERKRGEEKRAEELADGPLYTLRVQRTDMAVQLREEDAPENNGSPVYIVRTPRMRTHHDDETDAKEHVKNSLLSGIPLDEIEVYKRVPFRIKTEIRIL